ncbi:transcriptional regulator [Archaeoglobales archaeon]|nr:MAG: transcriptional regulator [Archaeoglobales archaeon]
MIPRFWRKIKFRYDLIGSYCKTCNNYFYPPRNLCPVCRRKGEIVECKLSEEGKVISYTIAHNSEGAPLVIALVELDHGARLLTQLACRPDEVKIGMRVKRVFRKYGEDGQEGIVYYGTKFIPSQNST